jgi:putative FmdB family regulatory protein
VPIYEYRCAACGHRFEVFQKFADAAVEECERCQGAVSKVLHPAALHFKGSGFYTTDYGRSGSKPRSSDGAETDGKKPSSGDAEGKPKSGDDSVTKSGAEAKKASTSKVKEASS